MFAIPVALPEEDAGASNCAWLIVTTRGERIENQDSSRNRQRDRGKFAGSMRW